MGMARFGHENLQHACSLKWVEDRMTQVTSNTLVRAHQTGGDVAATCYTSSVMNRLKGRVEICSNDMKIIKTLIDAWS